MSSPLIPRARWGTRWDGMSHSADWYVTIVEGLAGGTTENTGTRPPDSFNLWPALTGVNLTSPRTEVVHRVTNNYFNASLGDNPSEAIRVGEWKLLIGMSCNGTQVRPFLLSFTALSLSFSLLPPRHSLDTASRGEVP